MSGLDTDLLGAPLSPVAIAERALRADLAAKLIAAGKIGRTEADRNDQIWAAIGEWASERDADTWAAPAGAIPGEEFTTAYLDALQAARPAGPHYQPPEKEMAQ